MEKKSDNELMQLLIGRDTMALRVLYRRYEVAIFNFLFRCTGNREIAQELIQETFSRIWFAAHTFDPQRGHFKGWIYAIALNLARDEMSKKMYAYQYVDLSAVDDSRQVDDHIYAQSPDAVMEQSEIQQAIALALGQLKPHYREVIVMKNYQHLTFSEIAQVTRTPEGTIKARYHKAISAIKKHLQRREVSAYAQDMQVQ